MFFASELAGYWAAHAILTLSEGGFSFPMLAFITEDNQRKMERIVGEDTGRSVEYGRNKLYSNEMDANDAVLIYDGRIPVGSEKMDALIMEMRTYCMPWAEAIIALPYTPKESGGFRIHKPRFVEWVRCEDFDKKLIAHDFEEGIQKHQQGAAVFRQYYDPSK